MTGLQNARARRGHTVNALGACPSAHVVRSYASQLTAPSADSLDGSTWLSVTVLCATYHKPHGMSRRPAVRRTEGWRTHDLAAREAASKVGGLPVRPCRRVRREH